MCSNCRGDYEDPDKTSADPEERAASQIVRIGVWSAVIAICTTVLGFFIVWLYPLIIKALQ